MAAYGENLMATHRPFLRLVMRGSHRCAFSFCALAAPLMCAVRLDLAGGERWLTGPETARMC